MFQCLSILDRYSRVVRNIFWILLSLNFCMQVFLLLFVFEFFFAVLTSILLDVEFLAQFHWCLSYRYLAPFVLERGLSLFVLRYYLAPFHFGLRLAPFVLQRVHLRRVVLV